MAYSCILHRKEECDGCMDCMTDEPIYIDLIGREDNTHGRDRDDHGRERQR